ncbi:MAG: type II secretion system protein [Phycisphaerae bacterium]
MIRFSHRKAFTLIELLVVIAIIGLLATLIVPSFMSVRQTAREAVCATRVRGLTNAATTFAASHKQWYPNMGTDSVEEYTDKDPEGDGRLYIIGREWRDLFSSGYGILRAGFYSPSNRYWNRDDFWEFDDDGKELTVVGYFYYANRPDFEKSNRDKVLNGTDAYDAQPMFPARTFDNPYYQYVWGDLNRTFPKNAPTFVTPGETERWGANHMYQKTGWTEGSHVGMMDGSVQWVDGEKIKKRCNYDNAGYFW